MSIRKSVKNDNKFMADFMVKGVRYRRQWPTYEEAAAWESELKKRIRLGIPYTELLEGTGDSITLWELAEKTNTRYWEGTTYETKQRSALNKLINHYGHN